MQPKRGPLVGGRRRTQDRETDMRGALLWLLGIPLPIIILLYLFHVI
jgi:hypothetical protein